MTTVRMAYLALAAKHQHAVDGTHAANHGVDLSIRLSL
jgi:hypothetical protein